MKKEQRVSRFRILNLILFFGFLGGFFAAGSSASAQSGSDLTENSPFLPEGYKPPQSERRPPKEEPPPAPRGPEPLDKIEFRGLMTLGGKTSFSLYDPDEKKSYWIPLGRTDGGFTVVEYKDGEEAVVVRHDGKNRTISLHEAKVADLPTETPQPPRARRGGQRRQQAQESEDPEERMQNIAEEIRRRREARRAALERAQSDSQ